jgi:HD-like signal output (HDOD) protein
LAFTLAKVSRLVRPDEALLAGLMHNIGEVYIVARAAKQSDAPQLDETVTREWNPTIGRALIENWKLPDEIASAVAGQLDSRERTQRGAASVLDVLVVAVAFAAQRATDTLDNAAMAKMPAAVVLGLNDDAFMRIQLESENELQMLRAALAE